MYKTCDLGVYLCAFYLFQSSVSSVVAHHHYRYNGDYRFERHFQNIRLPTYNIIYYYDLSLFDDGHGQKTLQIS